MNIAFGFEIFYPERNGIITATIDLARHLVDFGHNVWFIVPAHPSLKEETIENGIHLVQIHSVKSIFYRGMKEIPVHNPVIDKLFKEQKIDVAHTLTPWLMARAINNSAKKYNIPVVNTHHTLVDNPEYLTYVIKNIHIRKFLGDKVWPVVYQPTFKKTWVITAPAHGTVNKIKEHYPKMDVRYISNGTDISRFTKEASCPVPEIISHRWRNKKTLIFVGRLGLEKGLKETIEAFAETLKTVPDAQLVIVGDGPYHKELVELVDRMKISEHVLLTGLLPNEDIIQSKVLSEFAAFVTASVSENQSMTVIEALCCDLPVICADVPNMSDLVSPEKGWLFEPHNPSSMAKCMIEALTNTELRDKKAIEARKSINKYDGKKIAREFESLYKELLEKKKKGFNVRKVKLK